MPSRTMTATQIERFVRSMEEQGVGVTRTKKGLLLRLPDGESTSVHFTNSDVRAHDNLIARLRRAGVRHPDDPKDIRELPANITDGQPVAPRSVKKVHKAIEALGWPEVVTVMQMIEQTGMVHVTTSRTLYQMGFKPVKGKRGARDWLVPQEVLDQRPQEASVESPTIEDAEKLERTLGAAVEGAREAGRGYAHPPESEDTTLFEGNVTEPGATVEFKPTEEREFIDTHDSWVLEIDRLVGWPFSESITVPQLRAVLESAGLDMEVRVWRR